MSSPNNSMTVPSHIEALYPNLNDEMIQIPLTNNTGSLEGRRVKICHPTGKKTAVLITGLGISALSVFGLYFSLNSDLLSASMGVTLFFSTGGIGLGGTITVFGAALFCLKDDLTC